MATSTKNRPVDAPHTRAELEQEVADLGRLNSELELRLTAQAVEHARDLDRARAAGARAAHDQITHRTHQYWALALADIDKPLTGLIHRSKNLGGTPTKDQLAEHRAAARYLEGVLAAARKGADEAQQPLQAMTADRDRLRAYITSVGRALHTDLGRPYTSRTGPCDCAGCHLITGMDTPQQAPEGPVQLALPGMEALTVPAPRAEQAPQEEESQTETSPAALPGGYIQPTLPRF